MLIEERLKCYTNTIISQNLLASSHIIFTIEISAKTHTYKYGYAKFFLNKYLFFFWFSFFSCARKFGLHLQLKEGIQFIIKEKINSW